MSFGRLRQRILLKCVPLVCSTVVFPFSTNEIIAFWRRRCRCSHSSLLQLSNRGSSLRNYSTFSSEPEFLPLRSQPTRGEREIRFKTQTISHKTTRWTYHLFLGHPQFYKKQNAHWGDKKLKQTHGLHCFNLYVESHETWRKYLDSLVLWFSALFSWLC